MTCHVIGSWRVDDRRRHFALLLWSAHQKKSFLCRSCLWQNACTCGERGTNDTVSASLRLEGKQYLNELIVAVSSFPRYFVVHGASYVLICSWCCGALGLVVDTVLLGNLLGEGVHNEGVFLNTPLPDRFIPLPPAI